MRTIQFLLAFLIVMLMVNLAQANDVDSTKIQKKIVKTILVNDDGKTVTDSTFVYEGDDVKVFVSHKCENFPGHGMMKHRMMGTSGKGMNWSSFDNEEFEMILEAEGDSSNVTIIKRPERMVKEFRFKHDEMGPWQMRFLHGDEDHQVERFYQQRRGEKNLIDLNDPDVISFEKEILKNGNEKITIIRK